MVNLTRIYTRTGDAGTTRLGDNSVTTKTDLRLEAYADVDELNSQLGLALAIGGLDDDVAELLRLVQNELFDVGADLSVPAAVEGRLRVEQSMVDRLEQDCDRFNADLAELRSFVLPGGTEAAARLQVARTVCRRAERDALRAAATQGLGPYVLVYLNRLSDLLFILARAANALAGAAEPLWKPGGTREG